MQIVYKEGDLFADLKDTEGRLTLIPHVVNSWGSWGAGFVVPLGAYFPESRESYFQWAHTRNAPHDVALPFRLGEVQYVDDLKRNIVVCNMLAQEGIGNAPDGTPPIRYEALQKCMSHVARYCDGKRCRICAPMLGSGLSGGSWPRIEEMIQKTWVEASIPVTVYYILGKTPPGWSPPTN